MFDFAAARRMMVDGQVRTSDVTDLRLIAAMLDIPRERFVPPEMAELAYLDLDTPVVKPAPATPVRRMLKPMVLAKLIQAAEIGECDRVLDVGCTTGYASAVLARLAGSVVALEEDPALARLAAENLQSFGLGRTQSVAGPLVEGCAQRKPFDAIVINGAFESSPRRAGIPTQRRWAAGWHPWSSSGRQGNAVPGNRRRFQRTGDFRCRCSAAARVCCPGSLCFLASGAVFPSGVAGMRHAEVFCRLDFSKGFTVV